MSERYDVLVAGEYYCDLIFSGLAGAPAYGREIVASGLATRPGGCYNMALGLTRLGLRTAWAADFGTDLFSRLVLEAAAADGIDPVAFRQLGRPAEMVSAAFDDRVERGFITYRGADVVPPERGLLERLAPRWLLQTFRYTPDWLAFMRAAREAGALIFGDCNGDEVTLATPGVRDFIALCDVFSPNEPEALRLTGAGSVEAALARLAEINRSVLVKRGAGGVSALVDGQRHEEAAPAVAVVDTVGAGDAFAAGYIAASLSGLPLTERLRHAVACGTLSTTGAGSSASPTAAELKTFAERAFRPPPRAASA
ncbi:MAG TPA: carbohydrate kinase family protein [Devosiaceae bacterium]|jgi:sugar/nucleoside kinase (ribokinase family)|nr:carbohydrate kinase family protein [Devosiaceae bacterium]